MGMGMGMRSVNIGDPTELFFRGYGIVIPDGYLLIAISSWYCSASEATKWQAESNEVGVKGVFSLAFGFIFCPLKAKSQTIEYDPGNIFFQKLFFSQCKTESISGYAFSYFRMELRKYIWNNF
jgi:hypothetical protein